jgi:two-component system chemotaxis response regulator CheY
MKPTDKTVMIVDDTSYTRVVMRRILEPEGFQIIAEACNGQEAIDLYNKHHPMIVMMDIIMPVKDGIQALQEIRMMDPQSNVVMCSSLGQEKMLTKAIGMGARDYIVKPLRADRVLAAIRAIMLLQEDR